MKPYKKELAVLCLQLFMFYIFPLFAGPTDAMGMVFLILWATLLLSAVLGCISCQKIKYLYPLAVAALFIPSNFIHYGGGAMVHALWYLVVSGVGILIGAGIRWLAARLHA